MIWSPRLSSRVEKIPGVARVTLEPKMTSMCSGRPRLMLPASSSSKTIRTRRGSSKTRVLETSTCRMTAATSTVVPVRGGQRQREAAHPGLEEHPRRAGLTRSHSSCSRAGSEVAANPLASGVTAIPSASAARRAISCPLNQTLTGYGA